MKVPSLGVGITYSGDLNPLLSSCPDLVDVLEVEPQTLWHSLGSRPPRFRVDDRAMAFLASLRRPVLFHGIGFPVGGTVPPGSEQRAPLLNMINGLRPVWMSEHLSFNRVRGRDGEFGTGFLLPPRQTREGARAAVRSIRRMKRQLGLPFAFETGVNYLRPREDEMTDGEFVAAVAREADCGILLDLHNVWTNEKNGREPLDNFLSEVPLDRVWEVHLAGGFQYRQYWLDAHSGAVPDTLFEIAQRVLPEIPNLGALIFEMFPSYIALSGLDLVRSEVDRLRTLWDRRGASGDFEPGSSFVPTTPPTEGDGPGPTQWEATLGALCVGRQMSGGLAGELRADPGLQIYRDLIGEFRASMVVSTLRLSCRLLMLALGDDGFQSLLRDYGERQSPELFAGDEGEGFAEFLTARDPDVPYLKEILAHERAVLRGLIHRERVKVRFPYDPIVVLRSLAEGRLPEPPKAGEFEIEITPDETSLAAGVGNPREVESQHWPH